MKKILLLLSVFISTLSFSQYNADDHSRNWPVGFSSDEMEMMRAGYPVEVQQYGNVNPPSIKVRNAAEWEEIEYIQITWTTYQSVLKDIVKYAQQECKVYIVCSDSNTVKSYLTSNSVPLTNLHFKIAPYNTVWCRDYGANVCYYNDVDSICLVDWKYNRPTRTKDDTVPSVIARDLNYPIYLTTQSPNDVIHTGGNYMSDGLGTAFSSQLVLQENTNHTSAQIDSIMKKYMGINRYIKMTVLPYDGIHHIDMHMKLLDEQTLLVGQYPQGISDGPQIEANIQYILSNFNSCFGTPYKIIRIPMPPEQGSGLWPNQGGSYLTYANASFINKTVILPTYYQQYDTTAIRIWKQSLPGYKIVPINCNSTIPASGALHCITHEIGVKDPMLIVHQQLPNTTNTINPYVVNARIQHRSGIASARVFWRTDTLQPYQVANMSFVSGYNWTGNIPPQQAGTTVYYYIEATSVSGKTRARPLPAPLAYWKFDVLGIMQINENLLPGLEPIFPNPSKGITCIPVHSLIDADAKISLVNILGEEVRVIYEGRIPSGEKNFFIDTSDIPGGTYAVMITTASGRIARKLIVK